MGRHTPEHGRVGGESATAKSTPCEGFTDKLEKELEDSGKLCRFWVRYVDDVFKIVGKENLKKTLEILNKTYRNIKLKIIRTDGKFE